MGTEKRCPGVITQTPPSTILEQIKKNLCHLKLYSDAEDMDNFIPDNDYCLDICIRRF